MTTSSELLNELESELSGELGEFEGIAELTHEGEAEAEAEQFFGALAGLARRAVASPALRRLALNAARGAIRGAAGGLGEHEGEAEGEFELEHELNPIRRVYPDAMMEHLAHEAQEASSEHEAAEAFLPLIPLVASKVLPLAMKAVGPSLAKAGSQLAAKAAPKLLGSFMRQAPTMSRAVSGLTRQLFRNPTTRPLIRTVPTIVRRASTQLLRQAARGRPITPKGAVGAIARNAVRVIGNPRAGVQAYRRSRSLDGRFHGGRGVLRRRVGRAGGGAAPGMPAGLGGGGGVGRGSPAIPMGGGGAAPGASGGGGCNCARACPACGR